MHGNDLPNLLSLIAILLTLLVIWFARQTVNEAKQTTHEERKAVSQLQRIVTAEQDAAHELAVVVTAQKEAAELAVTHAQEAFLERQHERVLKVGQLVDDMSWAIAHYQSGDDVPNHVWMPQRNELRHLLIGLKSPLPSCQQIIDAGTAFQAYESCALSRNEVEAELQRIDNAIETLHTAFRVTLRPST